MKSELPIRLVLVDPPAGVDFGIQRGRGAQYRGRIGTAAQTSRCLVRLFFGCRRQPKGWSAEFPGRVCSGPAGSSICLYRCRYLCRAEGHVLGPTDDRPARGDHVGTHSEGSQETGVQAVGENPGNRQGRWSQLRDGAVTRRLGNRPGSRRRVILLFGVPVTTLEYHDCNRQEEITG